MPSLPPCEKEGGFMSDRLFDSMRKFELALSATIFMSALVVLTVNIFLRFFLNTALTWAEEYMRYTIIWVTFIGSALCAEDNLHVGIDVFVQMSRPWVRKLLHCISMACATFFCGYMTVFSCRNTVMLFSTMQRSPIMQVPMGVIYISMPVGILFTSLRFGRKFVQCIRKKVADYADKPAADAEDIDLLKLD